MISALGRDLIILTTIFTLLSLVSFALRIYTLLVVRPRKFRVDDYIITFCIVCMIGVVGAVCAGMASIRILLLLPPVSQLTRRFTQASIMGSDTTLTNWNGLTLRL